MGPCCLRCFSVASGVARILQHDGTEGITVFRCLLRQHTQHDHPLRTGVLNIPLSGWVVKCAMPAAPQVRRWTHTSVEVGCQVRKMRLKPCRVCTSRVCYTLGMGRRGTRPCRPEEERFVPCRNLRSDRISSSSREVAGSPVTGDGCSLPGCCLSDSCSTTTPFRSIPIGSGSAR